MIQGRREFLTTAGATLAAAAMIPLPARTGVTIMGIGGLGVSVANRLARDGFRAHYWLWDSVSPTVAERAVVSVVPPATIHDPRSNIVLPRAVNHELERHRRPLTERVVMVAGLGGLTGSFLMPPIARLLDERIRDIQLVVPARVQHAAHPWRPGLFGWALGEAECLRTRTTILSTGLAFRWSLAAAGGDLLRARQGFRRWMVPELAVLVQSRAQGVTGRA